MFPPTLGFSYLTLLLALLLIPERNAQAVQRPELCLEPPFTDAHEHLRLNWQTSGSAHIGADIVHLTPDVSDKQGAIWNTNPILATDWEVQVNFRIQGRGVNLYGKGLAFWYTKDPGVLGPVFGGQNTFSGLGVFVDTFEEPGTPHKHRHPYVSAMVNNGSVSYSHDEDGTYMQLGGCSVNVRNRGHVTRMAISYLSHSLSVYVDVEGLGLWNQCFYSPGVHLPTGYYFGVSASTGELFDSHEIISILTLDMNPAAPVNIANSRIIPHAENFMEPKEYTPPLPKVEEPEPMLQKPSPQAGDKPQETPVGESPEIPRPWSMRVKIGMALILAVLVYFAVKTCRRHSERKKESMEKRMY